MPDLTTEYATACETNREWFVNVPASRGGFHTVSWGRLFGRDAEVQGCQYGYTCTCQGFAFRGTCKHVKAEEARDRSQNKARCGWDGRWDGQEPEVGGCCPECGGPTFVYAYGA